MYAAGILLADGRRRLAGVPLLVHAASVLLESGVLDQLVVVGPASVRAALDGHLPGHVLVVEAGGGSRHAAFHRGLSVVDSRAEAIVLHEDRRPLAPAQLVARVVAAVRGGADLAVPVLPVTETVKELDAAGRIVRTVPRETLVLIQTPQAARTTVVAAAHRDCPPDPADPAGLAGDAPLTRVEGSDDAFPITSDADLAVAEAILADRGAQSMR